MAFPVSGIAASGFLKGADLIVYINNRLLAWAGWAKRKADGGLGFPKECSYTRLQGRSGSGFVPNANDECWEIEQAVIALRTSSPLLHEVVELFYLRTMTVDQMAKACGCGVTTFYVRLHQAHQSVMDWLHDQDA